MNNTIKWSDIILSTMRKMFLNKNAITYDDLSDMVEDRNYATYINQIPDVMNELMQILNNRVIVNINTIRIDLMSTDYSDYITETDTNFEFNIKNYLDENIENNKYLWVEVIQDSQHPTDNFLFEEYDGILYIDKRFMTNTKITIKYRKSPQYFTNNTEFDTIIELPQNICVIIPLYLASELYKDDDIAIATQYRNQFETELNVIGSQQVNSFGTEHARNVLW